MGYHHAKKDLLQNGSDPSTFAHPNTLQLYKNKFSFFASIPQQFTLFNELNLSLPSQGRAEMNARQKIHNIARSTPTKKNLGIRERCGVAVRKWQKITHCSTLWLPALLPSYCSGHTAWAKHPKYMTFPNPRVVGNSFL
jgi:hypothetical protein